MAVPTVVAPVQQNSALLTMPYKVREHILSFFSYEEVARLRLVCHDLAKDCDSVLHIAFQKLGPALDRRVLRLRTSRQLTYKGCLICKALYLTIVEYKFLRAICWRYLRKVTFNFFAGRLLDLFYHILRLSYYDQEEDLPATACVPERCRGIADLKSNNATEELSFMVESFVRFFEINVEPGLAPSPTQIGVKIVDLLDCFLGSTCDLDLTYDNKTCVLHARYFCPLSGVLYSASDDAPAEKRLDTPTEANRWLSDLRELARKSNQRYIGNMAKELGNVGLAHKPRHAVSLFACTRRCKGRIRGADGRTVRENYEKTLQVGRESSLDSMGLKIIIRDQFPLWQWPLELDHMTTTTKWDYEMPYENEEDLQIAHRFDKLVNWAYPCVIPTGARVPGAGDGGRKMLWFQSEVCKAAAGGLLGRLKLSFLPTRFRQFTYLGILDRFPTVVIRDACLTQVEGEGVQVVLGRVRGAPGSSLLTSCV